MIDKVMLNQDVVKAPAYVLSGDEIMYGGMGIPLDDFAEYLGYKNYLTLVDRMMMADVVTEEYFVSRLQEWIAQRII